MNYLNTDRGKALFNKYLKKYEGKSSQKVYKSHIKKLFEWHNGYLPGITRKRLEQYKRSLGSDAKPKTVKAKFNIIKGFLKFLEQHEPGFTAPIGEERGSMIMFSSVDYTDSEAFRALFDRWQKSLWSENTRKTYGNHIIQAARFWGKEPKNITLNDLIDYHQALMHQAEKGNIKVSSIWGRFMAIKSFLSDYARRHQGFTNPLTHYSVIPNLTPPPKRTDLTDIFTEQEKDALLKLIKSQKSLRGIRDYALFNLQFRCALRINEACKFRYGDILEMTGTRWEIVIRGRKGRLGNKPDTKFYLTPKEIIPLKKWMEASGYPFDPETPVFLPLRHFEGGHEVDIKRARSNRPLSTRIMQLHFQDYLEALDLDMKDRNIRPHSLRETRATQLTEDGAPSVHLSKFLGHSSVMQLHIYSKYDHKKHNLLKK